jgi:hypothetical protein
MVKAPVSNLTWHEPPAKVTLVMEHVEMSSSSSSRSMLDGDDFVADK